MNSHNQDDIKNGNPPSHICPICNGTGITDGALGYNGQGPCPVCTTPNQELNCPPVCEKCNRCHRGECEVPMSKEAFELSQKPSDTPRTDAACYTVPQELAENALSPSSTEYVTSDFARQLECELNEACEITKRCEDCIVVANDCAKAARLDASDWQIRCLQAIKERDELRQKLNTLEAMDSARGIVDRAERKAKEQIDRLNAETARKVANAKNETSELQQWRACAERLAKHVSPHNDDCPVRLNSPKSRLSKSAICNCAEGHDLTEFERLKGTKQ